MLKGVAGSATALTGQRSAPPASCPQRLICLVPQGQTNVAPCDKTTRRANQQNRVHPRLKIFFALPRTQITGVLRPSRPARGGVGHVTDVGAGCGERGSV